MENQYVFRDGRVRRLKPEVKLEDYLIKHPGAYAVDPFPDMDQLSEWVSDCRAEALDGCVVEPDGTCEHGKPSWLMALGYI